MRTARPPGGPHSPAGTAVGSFRASLSMFTIVPVGGPAEVRKDVAAKAVLWLPAAGAVIAAAAAGVLLAVEATGHGGTRRLLAAALAIGVLAAATGGLHLDGLADTADGLGSRRPGPEALAIMRRPDIGPMGVAALVLVILIQVSALAVLRGTATGAAGLVAAAVTGRVAVVLAAGARPARPDGFGALVAAGTTARARAVTAAVALLLVLAGTAAVGGLTLAWHTLAAAAVGLLVAGLAGRGARRRLGGMTGDVFGALIELGTAGVLLTLALLS